MLSEHNATAHYEASRQNANVAFRANSKHVRFVG